MSDERLHRLDRRAKGLSALLVFALVFAQTAAIVFLSVAVVNINQRGSGFRDVLDNVNESTRILVDCTTPGHPCYERGQQGQATAVSELIRANIAVAYCAVQPRNVTVAEIQACVTRAMK